MRSILTSASDIRVEVSGRDTSIMNQREEKILLPLIKYIPSQEEHHGVKVIRDIQKKIFSFAADEDTATPAGVAE